MSLKIITEEKKKIISIIFIRLRGKELSWLLLLEQRRMSTRPDNVNTQGHHYNMGYGNHPRHK